MRMENREKRNSLSLEEQENYRILSDMWAFVKISLPDSNEAWEQAHAIDNFMKDFDKNEGKKENDKDEENKEEKLKLKDYCVGGLLLSSDQSKSYSAFDTKDGKIAKYISDLYQEYLKRNPEKNNYSAN